MKKSHYYGLIAIQIGLIIILLVCPYFANAFLNGSVFPFLFDQTVFFIALIVLGISLIVDGVGAILDQKKEQTA